MSGRRTRRFHPQPSGRIGETGGDALWKDHLRPAQSLVRVVNPGGAFMYPLDRLPEFQRAVLEAEQAWMRWRKSPPGNPDQEAQGEVLLLSLIHI